MPEEQRHFRTRARRTVRKGGTLLLFHVRYQSRQLAEMQGQKVLCIRHPDSVQGGGVIVADTEARLPICMAYPVLHKPHRKP